MAKLIRRLWYLVQQTRMERELAREIEHHRELTRLRLERDGSTSGDSADASRRTMGNTTLALEDARHVWLAPWLESVWQDAAYAGRTILRSPGFALSVVTVMALGIGAVTAVFNLVDGLVLRSLPVQSPDRLVYLSRPSFSYPVLTELRTRGGSIFSDLSAWNFEGVTVQWNTELEPTEVLQASGNFFSTLGVRAAVGRTFTPEDDAVGGGRNGFVAVISYASWQRRFAGDPSVIGRVVRVQGMPFTIIGVTPAGFFGVAPGLAPEMTVPLTALVDSETLSSRTSSWLHLIGRLNDDLPLARANATFQTIWPAVLEATAPRDMPVDRRAAYVGRTTALESARAGFSRIRNRFEEPLLILLGLVALLLVVATASAASLLLARAAVRRREFAVRLAIGAGRSRLIRQMLTEALVWTVVGAAAGLLIASWSSHALVAMLATSEETIVLQASPHWRVLIFGLVLAFLTATICAALPALRASRVDAGSALQEGRSIRGGVLERGIAGKSLVAAQVGLTVLLLFGAALFTRSLLRILNQDAGFERNAVLVLSTDGGAAGYSDERLSAFYATLLERLRALPGVASASMSRYPPISDGAWTQNFGVDGAPEARDDTRRVYLNAVTPDYIRTIGLRLLQGRDFSDSDREGAPDVVIVTESLARRFFAGQSAMGRTITMGRDESRRDLTIVGVVADAKYQSMTEETRSIAFLPIAQLTQVMSGRDLFCEIRVVGSPSTVSDAVRREVRTLDNAIPIHIQTVTERIRTSLVTERAITVLAVTIGLTALVLACAAVYGLLAYGVECRTSEIGLRMALGAEPGRMLWMVLRQSLVLGLSGIAFGIAASLALGQFARNLLFQVRENDAAALATAAATMLIVALCAALLPALRAARVEPLTALRME
jgi:predicted permease